MVLNNRHTFVDQIDLTAAVSSQSGALFAPLERCWVCRGSDLNKVVQDHMDFAAFSEQDPELNHYTGSTFWLMRCRDCGFVQPDMMPNLPQFFDRMYDQRWSEDWIEQEFDNGCKDFIFRGLLRDLSRRVSPLTSNKLLDIGAHVGRLIYLASKAGWQAEGIELNPRTSSYAARKTTLPVHRINAQELCGEGRTYDVVTMMDVLEHIPDPVAILRTANGLLTNNGWIAVKVPNGPNQLLKENLRARVRKDYKVSVAGNMVHVNHFSPLSLRLALKEAGFSNIKIYTAAPELSPTTTGFSPRAVTSDAMRLGVYYVARFVPGGIHTPLAMNLLAYAQKADSDEGISAD